LINLTNLFNTGGQLVVCTLYVNEDGEYIGATKNVKENKFECLDRGWKAMRDENKITEVCTNESSKI